ncbi:GspH/FimT family pseudopilin [Limnohabitans sp.]|uniref:GspH/FimT family pseudopilin n=1 Tax=Limnohabitans sp. TaxID=1907725 RepID=UPI00286F3436|nr:GspH/FimT family pseudopilin [Limnohabitans sp.]
MQRQHGLTLLELLVVLAIIGFAMAGVSLSLRDSSQTQLEREAQRLIALLEAARAQSRTSGVAVVWQPTPEGFAIRSPLATRTEAWLTAGTQAVVSTAVASPNTANLVVLGPEPILAPTRITLNVTSANNTPSTPTLRIGTDGLQPFKVVP